MASTRIPPELFDDILAYVWNVSRRDLLHGYKNTKKRRRALRYLSDCSSVCVYWANFIRPRMLQILVLRSAEDLHRLLALLRMPCSPRIRSLAHCLRTVAVFYCLGDYFWCHDLQRLQQSGVREEVNLRVHIGGFAPHILIRGKKCTVRHPLFYAVPRMIPFHRQPLLYVHLIIEEVNFPDGAGLFNLIRDISNSGILPRSVRCNRVQWEDTLTITMTSLNPTFLLNCHAHIKSFDVTTTNCTDNSLAAFAIHSCIGRRGRDALMLNPSDANRFLVIFREWASLLSNLKVGLRYCPIKSRAIHANPPFEREGDNRLLNDIQGTTGYWWRLYRPDRARQPKLDEDIVELGFYMRPGHGPGSTQTAYICSIVIGICNASAIQPVDWKTILHMALEFPMLDNIRLSMHGWDELRDFVGRQRETLDVAESRGRLRLYLLGGEGFTLEDECRRQVDLSDVIDLTNSDESAMENLEDEPDSLQFKSWDAEIESEWAFNEARREA